MKGIKEMRAFEKYNETQEFTESVKLPVGAYEIRIIRAEEQEGKNNSCALCILFDISEGEYKDFFMNKFNADKKSFPDNAKFKGVFRLWYPNGKDEKKDETARRKQKTALERIKKSNNLNIDFTREWDGAALKGCKVGLIFQEQEYDYNGYRGSSAQPYSIITLEDLREGNFKIPNPKLLKENTSNYGSNDEISADDDLPF